MYLVAEYIQISAPRDKGRWNEIKIIGPIKACVHFGSFQAIKKGCDPTQKITIGGETKKKQNKNQNKPQKLNTKLNTLNKNLRIKIDRVCDKNNSTGKHYDFKISTIKRIHNK